MTENRTHRSPLAPGEVRTHTVGARTFTVMHVAGGSFTQASVRETGMATRVLLTSQWDYRAVDAYADAIDAAEGERLEVNIAAASGKLVTPGDSIPGRMDDARREARRAAERSVPTLADDVAALRQLAKWSSGIDRRVLADMLARCDRIATQAPQRATDATGRGVWQHTCGNVRVWDAGPSINTSCSWCYKTGAWRPLYTIDGES